MLGPRPIIASLSLGATRTFRLRCMAKLDAQPQSTTSAEQEDCHHHVAPSSSQNGKCAVHHADAATSGEEKGCNVSLQLQTVQNSLQPLQEPQLWPQETAPNLQAGQPRELFLDKRGQKLSEAPVLAASVQPAAQLISSDADVQHSAAAPASRPQKAVLTGPVSSADVLLPHNTLVIMWPPMQEAWKHEVYVHSTPRGACGCSQATLPFYAFVMRRIHMYGGACMHLHTCI